MSITSAISRRLKSLFIKATFGFPTYGRALMDGLSVEFNRFDEFRQKISSAVVASDNLPDEVLDDYEIKYGISYINDSTNDERRARIIERASENGNCGPDWLQTQIQKAGFDLYVIVNEDDVSISSQFGTEFQFDDTQFGNLVTYSDPRNYPGEIVASSPVSASGGLYDNFGDEYQFDDIQFGTIVDGSGYPRPNTWAFPSDTDRWAYVFFLSPVDGEIVEDEADLMELSEEEWMYLRRLIMKLKMTRNWALAQITVV